METLTRVCAVCDSPEQQLVFEQPLIVPEGRCTYAGFDVVSCRRCGFLYADRTLDQRHIDEHYGSTTYRVAQDIAAAGEPQDYTVRLQASADFIIPHLRPESTLLDVGCGAGQLLDILRRAGFLHVQGMDQSPTVSEAGRSRYGVAITTGSIFDFNPGEFDAVTVCHVVEHITDLAAFLSRLRTLVSPRGFVYIEVPNAGDFERFADPQSVAESIYIRDLFTHFTPEHVNFFSVVSLRNLMRRYGFDEVACTGTPLGAIASVWRRSRVDQDTDTAGAVARYAEHSHELQRGALERIRDVAASGQEVFVWGAGLHTQRLLANGALAGLSIRAFVDSDPIYRGATLDGKPIIAPSEISGDACILISSYRAERKIEAAAQAMGLPNKVIPLYRD
jgi:2-polyprenyl-3-methyl-5-hydroxy-6-metoxy-1,4-benzoquinol methylase